MTVKSSISLTDQQAVFAKSLVEQGRYSSLSAVIQRGLDLLRQETEAKEMETLALRTLLEERARGPFISSEELSGRVDAMLKQKRRELGLED